MATYNTIIVLAEDQAAANTYWESAGAGLNTLSVALVPTSGPSTATPATHYLASGQFERYFPSAFTDFPNQFPDAVLLRFVGNSSGNAAFINSELASRGLQRQTVSP